MATAVRSFAKINIGLRIGALRGDGFHQLLTVYQTVALNDRISVDVRRGGGIEILCADERVPKDDRNTCYRVADLAMQALKSSGRVAIEIEKKLPVQGGLGGASGNAVATLIALQRALRKTLSGPEQLRIAATVGSDLPLFLVGGTVLGAGRGEEVYPLSDLPSTPCVIATPEISVSTPQAFSAWDEMVADRGEPKRDSEWGEPTATGQRSGLEAPEVGTSGESFGQILAKLTRSSDSDRMSEFSRTISAWLSGLPGLSTSGKSLSGVPARSRGRAESPLLDLVRTGIENDFEKVVFPKYPELREVKCALERAGAMYASLSGSGSAVYGLFKTTAAAERAAAGVRRRGVPAAMTVTINRIQYWRKLIY
jgi:4-diphosphocytidyl-2-C-methyl-D-erythritol kinase